MFSLSPLGNYCKVKLLRTGKLVPARMAELQTGALS